MSSSRQTQSGFFGLGSWFGNFTQIGWNNLNVTALADVRSPYLEYGIYCTFKCIQVASFIGGCIAHPIYRVYLHRKLTPETRTNNSSKVIRNICRKMQGRFLLAGFAFAPAATAVSVWLHNYTEYQLCERCYEIRRDEWLVYDRATAALGFGGWYWKRFQGAVDGINLAGCYALLYFNYLKENTNVLLIDRVKFKNEKCYKDTVEARNSENSLLQFLHGYTPASSSNKDNREVVETRKNSS